MASLACCWACSRVSLPDCSSAYDFSTEALANSTSTVNCSTLSAIMVWRKEYRENEAMRTMPSKVLKHNRRMRERRVMGAWVENKAWNYKQFPCGNLFGKAKRAALPG